VASPEVREANVRKIEEMLRGVGAMQ